MPAPAPRRLAAATVAAAALLVGGAAAPARAQGAPADTAPAAVLDTAGRAAVVGVVRADDTGEPVPDVQVDAVGLGRTARTGADGRFTLRGLRAGRVSLRLRRLGFQPLTIEAAADTGTAAAPVELVLARAPTPLARMVVTPGQYGVLRDGPATATSLSREQIAAAPQVGEDIFRIASRLPGVAASDFSAAFRVRGGAQEELLVTFDGLELYEPFHLKDFDGALSIIDLGAVGGLDLNTGGFGARFGNRLTGVMAMRSLTPEPDGARTEVALTLTTLRATSRGTFAGGRGGWLWSARRGFLEYALRLVGEEEEVRPRYHDAFAKLTFQLTPDHDVALHVLGAEDRLRYDADPTEPALTSAYGSGYLWLTWQARFTDRVTASTVLSTTALDWSRDGDRISPLDRRPDLAVRDRRDFGALAARQDWTFEQSPRAVLTWGVQAQRLRATVDYERFRREPVRQGQNVLLVPTRSDVALEPAGTAAGAWVAQRLRRSALTVEGGLRLDRQVRESAASSVAEWHWGPRVAAAYELGDRTMLRAAWGRYHQAQGVHELQVQDSLVRFDRAELAEHRVVGVERRVAGLEARVEAYERRTLRARPRFSSADNTLELFPEIGPDRRLIAPSGGVARGVELLLRRERGTGISWSASYALARAVDRVDGRWMPRPLDQRHTFTTDLTYRPSGAWTMGASWVAHTGWPTTAFTTRVDTLRGAVIFTERTYGQRNADRLRPYHRLDARVTRRFDVGGGRLSFFADVFNAYNRRGPRPPAATGSAALSEHFDALLPRVPSFGVMWEF